MYMGLIQEIGIQIPYTAVFSIEHQRQSNTVGLFSQFRYYNASFHLHAQ